jgi:hypothetical protein
MDLLGEIVIEIVCSEHAFPMRKVEWGRSFLSDALDMVCLWVPPTCFGCVHESWNFTRVSILPRTKYSELAFNTVVQKVQVFHNDSQHARCKAFG